MTTDARYEALVEILKADGLDVTTELDEILRPAIQKAGYNSAPALELKLKPLVMKLKPLAEDGKVRTGYALFSHTKFAQFKAEGVEGTARNQRVASEWKALGKEGQEAWKKGHGTVSAPNAPASASQPIAKKARAENKHSIFMSWAMGEQSYATRFPSGSARLKQLNLDWKAMGKEGQVQWVADFKAGLIVSNPAPKKDKKGKAVVVAPVVAPVATEEDASENEAEIEALNQAIDELPEESDEEDEEETDE